MVSGCAECGAFLSCLSTGIPRPPLKHDEECALSFLGSANSRKEGRMIEGYDMKTCLLAVLIVVGLAVQAGPQQKFKVFDTPTIAAKYYSSFEQSGSQGASSSSRGGGRYSSITTLETRWYSVPSYTYLGSDFAWSEYSCNTCGTVVPYPDSDFTVLDVFEFIDPSKSSTKKYRGMFVAVKIGLSSTSNVSKSSRLRAMKNLVEAGGNYKDKFGKPKRFLPLKKTVRMRYRFLNLKTFYSDDSVGFLLFDVNEAMENKSVSAATFER